MDEPFTLNFLIVHAFHYPSPKAHALQILETAFALCRRGHSVSLQIRSEDAGRAREDIESLHGGPLPENLHVHIVGGKHKGLAGLSGRLQILWKLLTTRGRMVIYARHRNQALWASFWVRIVGRRHRLIYEFHNLDYQLAIRDGRRSHSRLLREEERLCRHAHALVAISQPLADDIETIFAPKCPIAVIPDGVNLRRFSPDTPPQRAGTILLGYAGSLYEHKGVDRLLDMLEELPSEFRLRIVGGNDHSDLERLVGRCASSTALSARVEFSGQVPPSEVPEHLEDAQIILIPSVPNDLRSQRYTSPLKLFESLAMGRPIVAVPSPTLLSILRDQGVSYFSEGPSAKQLAAAVQRAVGDASNWEAMSAAACRLAKRYSWDARAARIEAIARKAGPKACATSPGEEPDHGSESQTTRSQVSGAKDLVEPGAEGVGATL